MDRTSSLVVYLIGLVLILAAVWVIFTQTELADYIPASVAVAVVLLIVGIAVMASSDRFATRGRTTTIEERHVSGPPPGTPRAEYEQREVRYDDDWVR